MDSGKIGKRSRLPDPSSFWQPCSPGGSCLNSRGGSWISSPSASGGERTKNADRRFQVRFSIGPKVPLPCWYFSPLLIMKTQENLNFQQAYHKKKKWHVGPFHPRIESDEREANSFKLQAANQGFKRKGPAPALFPAFFWMIEAGNSRARKADE